MVLICTYIFIYYLVIEYQQNIHFTLYYIVLPRNAIWAPFLGVIVIGACRGVEAWWGLHSDNQKAEKCCVAFCSVNLGGPYCCQPNQRTVVKGHAGVKGTPSWKSWNSCARRVASFKQQWRESPRILFTAIERIWKNPSGLVILHHDCNYGKTNDRRWYWFTYI